VASFETKFLKKRFTKVTSLQTVAERKSTLVKMIDKPTSGGSSVAEACIPSGPQGWSYSLPAAQAVSAQSERGASQYEEFNSILGEYHGSAVISARAVACGKTDADAYLRQLTEVLESSVESFGSISARKLFGPIGGSIGRILAVNGGGSAGELTLTIAGDAFNMAPGMILQAADSTGNGVPANVRAGLGYVKTVSPDNDTGLGHVEVSATSFSGATATPSGWANNDYLFRNGDIATGLDLSDKQIRSYQAWLTLTAATDTYNGVNRAQHAGLSGFRVPAGDLVGLSILDRIQLLCTTGNANYGANSVDVVGLGPKTWQQLANESQSYATLSFAEDLKLGVTYLKLMCSHGTVKIVMDPNVQESDIWAFTISKLKIYNADGFPALDDIDGNEILRQNAAAQYEIRYHTFCCPTVGGQPWMHGRCSSGN
jgi:hypothetical protein